MSARGRRSGLRVRRNLSAANNASWLVAVAILAAVIPVSDKVAPNLVFFAAHDLPPYSWGVLLAVVLAACWLALAGILWATRRLLPASGFDVVASGLMLLVSWFFVGNVLAVTVARQAPWLGALLGLLVAAALTLLARRYAMGTVLMLFAVVAAGVPMAATLWAGSQVPAAKPYSFTASPERPDVVWVVADELSYPAAFDAQGVPRPGLTNLAALAADATTYTGVYTVANFTDYAVPAMLAGRADLSIMDDSAIQQMRTSLGIVDGLSSEYAVVLESPMFSYDCDDATCAQVGERLPVLQAYAELAKDAAAIAGRTTLAVPLAEAFPAIDGRWSGFWDGGEEFGDDPDADTVDRAVAGIDSTIATRPGAPLFALWHSIRTHAPWVLDPAGKQIYPARVPVVPGAHMIGEEADERYTSPDLEHLERRLWHSSVQDFDRQLGRLIDHLKQIGRYDDTMIIVTADHGAAMTQRADRRIGDDDVQRWSQIAHVPLVVKYPGQDDGRVERGIRSTGQIAATVLAAAGAQAGADAALAADLTQEIAGGPVFTNVRNGEMTSWHRPADLVEVDPWRADDFVSASSAYPFAVGLSPDVLGRPAPDGASAVPDPTVETLPGDSSQQVVIVDRPTSACSVDDRVGLVIREGTVIGSVLWEGPDGSADGVTTRGWAIVPRGGDPAGYAFTCAVPESGR